jgi:hypothetical protein
MTIKAIARKFTFIFPEKPAGIISSETLKFSSAKG